MTLRPSSGLHKTCTEEAKGRRICPAAHEGQELIDLAFVGYGRQLNTDTQLFPPKLALHLFHRTFFFLLVNTCPEDTVAHPSSQCGIGRRAPPRNASCVTGESPALSACTPEGFCWFFGHASAKNYAAFLVYRPTENKKTF